MLLIPNYDCTLAAIGLYAAHYLEHRFTLLLIHELIELPGEGQSE
jgi:hypothetical protein